METNTKKENDLKPKIFELCLSDISVGKLFKKAAAVGLLPEKLLEKFIEDLISYNDDDELNIKNETYSDGCIAADRWHDACERPRWGERTLIRFIFEEEHLCSLTSFEELRKNDYIEGDFCLKEDDEESVDFTIQQYLEWYYDYNDCMFGYIKEKDTQPNIEEEKENACKWYENYRKINGNECYGCLNKPSTCQEDDEEEIN